MKKPTYKKRKGKKKVLTNQIKNILRGYIKENAWKRDHYMSKQQMKIIDMHEKLKDAGFKIGYTTVRNFVNQETAKAKEVYIRRHCEPGYEVEFDWGELKLVIEGKMKKVMLNEVEFVRRKAFSSEISFTSLQEANEHLNQILQKLNNRTHYEHKEKQVDLMKKERAVSKPVITPFDCAELVECRVNKYGTIVIRQNHYSVPEGHVGKYIKAKVGATEIKLFIDGELVAIHQRNWGLHNWVMDINHYLKTFQKKKGALVQSEALRQAPTKIKNIYYEHYTGKEKEFIELLLFIKENDNLEQVLEAIKQLENIRLDYVSTERILFICEQQSFPKGNGAINCDETVNQSENNMMAYTRMFNQLEGSCLS